MFMYSFYLHPTVLPTPPFPSAKRFFPIALASEYYRLPPWCNDKRGIHSTAFTTFCFDYTVVPCIDRNHFFLFVSPSLYVAQCARNAYSIQLSVNKSFITYNSLVKYHACSKLHSLTLKVIRTQM